MKAVLHLGTVQLQKRQTAPDSLTPSGGTAPLLASTADWRKPCLFLETPRSCMSSMANSVFQRTVYKSTQVPQALHRMGFGRRTCS